MISITATELNYLIFRYLTESGFAHAAFTLGYEAGIDKNAIDGNIVPPGALITFIQKGIQYLELEANMGTDDLESDEDFQFLHPMDLITKDVHELQKIIKEKKESLQKEKSKGKEKRNNENGRKHDAGLALEKKELSREKENEKHQKEKEKEKEKERDRDRDRDRDKIEKEKEREREIVEKAKGKENEKPFENVSDANLAAELTNGRLMEHEADEGAEPMEICPTLPSVPCEIPDSDVKVLQGHTSEVFACAWDPTGSLLASGSGDATARIWTVDGPASSSLQNEHPSVVLRHYKGKPNEKSKDVTTLDWNVEGSLLATGSYDGQARIWSRDGELLSTLYKHKGPIFSLKWNKKGDYLLSGSVDKTAIVWDAKSGEWKQQFELHRAPALDVDWRNNVSFATCSADSMIYVCKVGEEHPVKRFQGHQGEVNAIKWDPTGILLASCSDDCTAKIWTLKQDTCLLDLKEHTKEIYTVRWSPTGPGTNNPNRQLVLASASFDSTIKIWDANTGGLLSSLDGHREPVYSVAFSPSGEYLASGSLDRSVHIWSVKENKIVRTFCGKGGIFEVVWNKEGNKIAACFANNVICVLDFRM